MLALLSDPSLREEVDRVAAAVGTGVVRLAPSATLGRTAWNAATVVVVDEVGAQRCVALGLPRRAAVFVVAAGAPTAEAFHAAMSLGAQAALSLPAQADELVRCVSETLDGVRADAGASVFAAALALGTPHSVLIDLDPIGGGIDLLLGAESAPGLRWPDIAVKSGRLNWAEVRAALPAHGPVAVLSAGRSGVEIDCGAAEAIIESARRGGFVVCDVPRRLTDAAVAALELADLVTLICPGDVRSCAAAATIAPTLSAVNPNVGLVVRGPAPGGLRAADVADVVGLPLLAAMRPEPMIGERLERGGLRLRARSPLATAATAVLQTLGRRPGRRTAAAA
ncbi:septum site-determining protein Ssd [Mycolicibacterium chitae]|nr:septum site-determining protein Ssd [Mycolicibacterium chitae]